MNNSELDQILKSVPVPERPPHYWEQFPGKVMARVHWSGRAAPAPRKRARASHWLRFAAAGCCLAILCALAVLGFRRPDPLTITDQQMQIAQKYLREIEPVFSNQVQGIVLDSQNPQLILAEAANIPSSAPLLLRIQDAQGYHNYVTFSGQQVCVNGEACDVLVDHLNNVLLVGRDQVWSSAQNQFAARIMENAL
jgi:hypothetical protein